MSNSFWHAFFVGFFIDSALLKSLFSGINMNFTALKALIGSAKLMTCNKTKRPTPERRSAAAMFSLADADYYLLFSIVSAGATPQLSAAMRW